MFDCHRIYSRWSRGCAHHSAIRNRVSRYLHPRDFPPTRRCSAGPPAAHLETQQIDRLISLPIKMRTEPTFGLDRKFKSTSKKVARHVVSSLNLSRNLYFRLSPRLLILIFEETNGRELIFTYNRFRHVSRSYIKNKQQRLYIFITSINTIIIKQNLIYKFFILE